MTATHVALLRGINVGGNNKVPMAELRTALTASGFAGVSTYIQSGNVLFSTAEPDTAVLEEGVAEVIARTFGINVGVVVVTRDQLAAVLSRNPYPSEPNPKYVHVVFLGAEPDQARLAAANAEVAAKGSRDTVTAGDRVLYLHTPDGYGTSELGKVLVKLSKSSKGTARNLATTAKLLSLCDGAG
jgi:uncharacterized protein (DUF1697 family)